MPLVAAVALSLSLAPDPKAASFPVRWEAPDGCPGTRTVQASFQRHARAGQQPTAGTATVIAVPGGGFVLELRIEGTSGESTRRVEAEDCAALAETAGLLLAVGSESSSPDEASEVVPAAPSLEPQDAEFVPLKIETGPPASKQRSNVNTTAPSPSAQRFPVGVLIRAEGVVQALRVLPQIGGGGVAGALGVLGRTWRAELRGLYVFPQSREYEDVVVGASFDLWTIGAVGCWAPGGGRLSVPLCAGGEAGSLRGKAGQLDEPGRASAPYLAATADASVVFTPIPRVGLRLGGGGIVSLARPRFHVREFDTLFRAGPAGLRISLGVEVRFSSPGS